MHGFRSRTLRRELDTRAPTRSIVVRLQSPFRKPNHARKRQGKDPHPSRDANFASDFRGRRPRFENHAPHRLEEGFSAKESDTRNRPGISDRRCVDPHRALWVSGFRYAPSNDRGDTGYRLSIRHKDIRWQGLRCDSPAKYRYRSSFDPDEGDLSLGRRARRAQEDDPVDHESPRPESKALRRGFEGLSKSGTCLYRREFLRIDPAFASTRLAISRSRRFRSPLASPRVSVRSLSSTLPRSRFLGPRCNRSSDPVPLSVAPRIDREPTP